MAWDKTLPIEGALAPTYNNIMRANQAALETALNAWVRFETGGTQSGQPRQGSSRVYFQDAVPTARLDGDYFDSTDLGCIWIDSNSDPDNQFSILTAADGAGTETWTPISTEIIAVLLASARTFAEVVTFSKSPVFTLGIVGNDAYLVGRNNAGDGNINILKVNTSDGITVGAVTTLPDTSALATSGAPVADAQIANKKYVNDQDDVTEAKLPSSLTGTDNSKGETAIGELQLKWGSKTVNTAGATAVSFTSEGLTNFDNNCFQVFVTWSDNDTQQEDAVHAYTVSKTGFTIYNTAGTANEISWFAIGR